MGWEVGPEGLTIPQENIEALCERLPPKNVREVKSFSGYVNYHRRHLRGLAEVAAPLYSLIGSLARRVKFVWQACHQEASEKLIGLIVSAPVVRI